MTVPFLIPPQRLLLMCRLARNTASAAFPWSDAPRAACVAIEARRGICGCCCTWSFSWRRMLEGEWELKYRMTWRKKRTKTAAIAPLQKNQIVVKGDLNSDPNSDISHDLNCGVNGNELVQQTSEDLQAINNILGFKSRASSGRL